ncbi:hypothetical protein ACFWU5_06845 [Nocardia sp. NPDC058640]|uniref:hypothetical protein n=1 Tax=Nocardia sp. NPDC058640 TaxID=3346571 RepID=UPI00364645DC
MFTRTRTTRRQRVIGAGVSTIGALAATVGLAAPPASADAISVTVDPGFSIGLTTSFGMGCSYKVTAAVSGLDNIVYFTDEGGGASFNPNYVTSNSGIAETTWTPATPGIHTIRAVHFSGGGPAATIVTVGTGINTGSGCVVLP